MSQPKMKAFVFSDYSVNNHPLTLKYVENEPMPKIQGTTDLVVKVEYSGISPLDYKFHRGDLYKVMPRAAPSPLGFDFCGIVIRTGPSVSQFKPGDQVMGFTRKYPAGAFAEYLLCDEIEVCKIPDGLDHKIAGSYCLNIQAAWDALSYVYGTSFYEKLLNQTKIEGTMKNYSIIVLGASGGVGTCVTLLAKHYFGMEVWAVCSKKNAEYVKSLGADHVIDYNTTQFAEEFKNRDHLELRAIVDCVGCYLTESEKLFTDDRQIYVTLNPNEDDEPTNSGKVLRAVQNYLVRAITEAFSYPRYTYVHAKPKGRHIARAFDLLIQKKLVDKLKIQEVIPLAETKKAYDKIRTKHTVGKIAIAVAPGHSVIFEEPKQAPVQETTTAKKDDSKKDGDVELKSVKL